MSVSLEKRGRIAFVTLDQPPVNVLNLPMLAQLKEIVDSVARDDAIDVLVIYGSGRRAFSAGVDVKDHSRQKVPAMLEAIHGVVRSLLAAPKVTIALVRGACLGGGFELAASCDFILASEDSFFATPEIEVGCFPPVALARLPSQIGYGRAAEWILTGRRFSAQEAMAMGLLTRVVPTPELSRALESFLEELQGKSRAVLRIALKGLREISLKDFSSDLRRSEDLYLHELLQTEDVEEGVRAFLEKRKPTWSHR